MKVVTTGLTTGLACRDAEVVVAATMGKSVTLRPITVVASEAKQSIASW
jgi:hypothetical protein